jgi:hypothetical protein
MQQSLQTVVRWNRPTTIGSRRGQACPGPDCWPQSAQGVRSSLVVPFMPITSTALLPERAICLIACSPAAAGRKAECASSGHSPGVIGAWGTTCARTPARQAILLGGGRPEAGHSVAQPRGLGPKNVYENLLGHVAPPPSAVQLPQKCPLPEEGAPPRAAEPHGSHTRSKKPGFPR